MTRSSLVCYAFLFASFFPAAARDIAGADQALARFRAEVPKETGTDVDPEAANRQLKANLDQLAATVATLPPQEAASRWLALFDEMMRVKEQAPSVGGYVRRGDLSHGDIGPLLKALPGPAAWDALDAAVAARKAENASLAALRVLTTTLREDVAGCKGAMAAWRKARPGASGNSMEEIEKWISEMEGTPLSPARRYEAALRSLEQGGEDSGLTLMPDLVAGVGAARAEEILKRLLVRSDVTLSEVEGTETRRLALKIALALKDRLAAPQWVLIRGDSEDEMALYAVLEQKFPRKSSARKGDSERREADGYYLRHLIVTKKIAEATSLAQEIAGGTHFEVDYGFPLQVGENLSPDAVGKPVTAFLFTLLEQHPELPYWGDLVRFATRFGSESERPGEPPAAFLQKMFARQDLAFVVREKIGTQLLDVHLKIDQPEEAVRVLRILLAGKLAAMAEGRPKKDGSRSDDPAGEAAKLGLRLMKLGRLLKNEEWVNQGIADTRTALQKTVADGDPDSSDLRSFTDLLFQLNRPDEGEDLLVDCWIKTERKDDSRSRYWGDRFIEDLAVYYNRLGRHADVVKLMEDGIGWDAPDLARFNGSASFKLTAAQSLAAVGRKEEARKILLAYLQERGGDDTAYEVLLKLGGDDVIPVLDGLFARDRFEERPLIWKAKLLLDGGRTDEAEKTIRSAIAVDPSDGEQGKGDRLRAYAVLADVMEKKGDAAQAGTLRTAVSAIRLSEDADDFRYAGLTKRAVAMYEKSLGLFADAYCIQSRLALTYAASGDLAKAEDHYRRAYELMPESFGEMESHCFGCEGIFHDGNAQGIAEKVFTRLAARPDAKAQTFYLLGYLRDEQKKPGEALEQYRRAVQIDPDYYNAWERILYGVRKVEAPAGLREEAALNLMRLAPSSAESHLDEVFDFRALWPRLVAAAQADPQEPETLFEFKASKAEAESGSKADAGLGSIIGNQGDSGDDERFPGGILAKHDVIRAICYLILY